FASRVPRTSYVVWAAAPLFSSARQTKGSRPRPLTDRRALPDGHTAVAASSNGDGTLRSAALFNAAFGECHATSESTCEECRRRDHGPGWRAHAGDVPPARRQR